MQLFDSRMAFVLLVFSHPPNKKAFSIGSSLNQTTDNFAATQLYPTPK